MIHPEEIVGFLKFKEPIRVYELALSYIPLEVSTLDMVQTYEHSRLIHLFRSFILERMTDEEKERWIVAQVQNRLEEANVHND